MLLAFSLAYICLTASLGGVFLGFSLKAYLVMKYGFEQAQKIMFRAGLWFSGSALLVGLLSWLTCFTSTNCPRP